MKIRKFFSTIILTIISLPLLLLSVLATGGGHSNFGQMYVLFPWMFCFGFVFKFLNNAGIFIVPALLQFLAYGLILDWFRAKDEVKWGLLFVIVLHTILVALTLKFF